jgi:hypothetical protein
VASSAPLASPTTPWPLRSKVTWAGHRPLVQTDCPPGLRQSRPPTGVIRNDTHLNITPADELEAELSARPLDESFAFPARGEAAWSHTPVSGYAQIRLHSACHTAPPSRPALGRRPLQTSRNPLSIRPQQTLTCKAPLPVPTACRTPRPSPPRRSPHAKPWMLIMERLHPFGGYIISRGTCA